MDKKNTTIPSRLLTEDRPRFELIPPHSDEFRVYGGDDVVERARAWALANRYLLARGVPACAHGFYMLSMCPHRDTCLQFEQFDHVSLWVPDSISQRNPPFLLSHPYADEIGDDTRFYAKAHGLVIDRFSDDNWYGTGTIPIRLSLPQNWPTWPLENAAMIMLTTQPVAWPEEGEEELVACDQIVSDSLARRPDGTGPHI